MEIHVDMRLGSEQLVMLMRDVLDGLSRIYGLRLKGVYLYGSYARQEADSESDVDVLVVLDKIWRYGDEVTRAGSMGSALSLKYGVSISHVFISEEDWLHADTSFLGNVREEAIPA